MSSGGIISKNFAGNIHDEAVMAAVGERKEEGGGKDNWFHRRETGL